MKAREILGRAVLIHTDTVITMAPAFTVVGMAAVATMEEEIDMIFVRPNPY